MIEPSNDDKREGVSLFRGSELDPSPNFVHILQEMLEAGMVGAILESRKTYCAWFDRLEGEAADEVAKIFSRLAALEAIEAEYGFGAALDLNHRLVKKLVEWDQLGSVRHRNALTFAASRCPHWPNRS